MKRIYHEQLKMGSGYLFGGSPTQEKKPPAPSPVVPHAVRAANPLTSYSLQKILWPTMCFSPRAVGFSLWANDVSQWSIA
jgi:hypothetical protein